MNFLNNIKSLFNSSLTSTGGETEFMRTLEGEYDDRQYMPDVAVDENLALSLSAVWACVRIISESVATLPLHLKRRTTSGRETVKDHPLTRLTRKPSPLMNGIMLRQALVASTLLTGNGYAHISRRDAQYRPTRLDFILPHNISVFEGEDDMFYLVNGIDGYIPSRDMIHVRGLSTDGLVGISPIRQHSDNFRLSIYAQSYGKEFFRKGINPSGILTYPSTLDQARYDDIKKDFQTRYAGIGNSHAPILLEGGMKFERIGIPPEDAQFLGTRKFQKTEIATIYGVPPHMIADLERATNNNIEHQGTEFVQHCLMPHLTRIAEEFNTKLLYEDEQDEYYYHFNVNGLMRGDTEARSKYYTSMCDRGLMCANEVRELEDMNSYPGGDKYYIQINMQAVDKINNQTPTK